ncbi:MAG: 5-oxoprolinase subunit PxpA [Pseudomonadota bacterium]
MTQPMRIDLNADLGEGFGPWKMGDDLAMLDIVTSASIACGGHAGDSDTMFHTVSAAAKAGVTVGAHPGFEDKKGFGRRRLPLSERDIERLVASQVGALRGIAALAGTHVAYVKPHGALGNWAAEDRAVANAIARAVKAVMPEHPRVLAIAGSELVKAADAHHIVAVCEIFADRGYTAQGGLIPRGQAGDLIHDVPFAIERLAQFIQTGRMPTHDGGEVELRAESICVHGDSAVAVQMAKGVRDGLQQAGVAIQPFCHATE